MAVYSKRKEDTNASNRAASREGRDIVDGYPPSGNLQRRGDCERNFRLFCETYFSSIFYLPWSDDHIRVISRIEAAVLEGGLFALAMPRSWGKTALCARAAIWALLYGHIRFVSLLGATEPLAESILVQIKAELEINDTLAEDFREVCYPIRRLENNARRCIGQLFDGERTRMEWSSTRITLPVMPEGARDGKDVGGSIITVAGLTGAIRGQSHLLPNGELVRPQLVIPDDPQTRESARSPSQNEERLAILNGDVLGMAGPGKKIAAIVPCTVIFPDDMADRLLDRKSAPQWRGERTKAVYTWPKNEKLWEQYRNLRADCHRSDRDTLEATEFYKSNRAAMDEGSVVAWPHRFDNDEISAIQFAMNIRCDRGEAAFNAEYQNEPKRVQKRSDALISIPSVMLQRLSGVPRGIVPIWARHLTAYIDVQGKMLWWIVCAWADNFTGSAIDYGAWPDQGRNYFTLEDAKITMQEATGAKTTEGAIIEASKALEKQILGCEWRRQDGVVMRVGQCLKDRGFKTSTVDQSCRNSSYASILWPAKGLGVGPTNRPIEEYTKRRGERIGDHWMECVAGNRVGKYVLIDTNHWKAFAHERIGTVPGDPGSFTFFGSEPRIHQMIVDHCHAESCEQAEGRAGLVYVFKLLPSRPDNHLWDGIVGSMVGASRLGAMLPGAGIEQPRKRRRLSAAEIQARRSA